MFIVEFAKIFLQVINKFIQDNKIKSIVDSKRLEKEFLRLQDSYEKYYWLT